MALYFALLSVTVELKAEVQLAETATYYLPGFTQRLERVKFGRLEGHSLPVILSADGRRLCLYAPDNNTCLFQTDLDERATDYTICFADVDRDLVPDILIGYYYNAGVFQADTVCRLEFYSGGTGYSAGNSFFFTSEYGAQDPRRSPWSFVGLTALDIDSDGVNELFFAYDRYEMLNVGEMVLQVTSGQTRLCNAFPESDAWDRPVLLDRIEKIGLPGEIDLFIVNRFESITLLPARVTARSWTEIISSEGDSLFSVGQPVVPACLGDSSVLTLLYEYLAAGDMNPLYDGPEMLVRVYYEETCYDGDEIVFDATDTDIRMYSLGSLPEFLLLWNDPMPDVTSGFRFLPQSRGHYFSIIEGRVAQHSGLDGEVCHLSALVNADTLIWCENPDIAGGDLIGIRNQTLSIYGIDISTGIEGDPRPETLPSGFEMGSPYPNPFNSACVIDYCLPTRAAVRIEVYNMLGQKVKCLVDDVGVAGRYQVEWHANDLNEKPAASGVYLVKMKAGGFTDSKKVLLLK